MRTSATRARPTERSLHHLWQKTSNLNEGLVTEGGDVLRVLYPGRPSSQAGPDFRDAVIVTSDGRLLRGDVELHLDAPDWRNHGHHRDPRYNGVVLHVVLWPRGQVTSPQEANLQAPILALAPLLDALGSTSNSRPGTLSALASLDEKGLGWVLDRAGDERFLAKSNGLAMEMEGRWNEGVLYQGLMESLGYADNRRPFLELAKRAPLELVMSLAKGPPGTRFLATQALLLGVAGLLPYLGSEEQARELRALRKRLHNVGTMSVGRWNLFRVRPQNHPVRRIIGMARLLDRFMEVGLVRGLHTLVARDEPVALARGLMATHFIGRGRADEMAVNVVLPFFYAWARMAREPSVMSICLDVYARYPRMGDNRITREMRRLLFSDGGPRVVTTARRQQGLIHLYKTLNIRLEGMALPLDAQRA